MNYDNLDMAKFEQVSKSQFVFEAGKLNPALVKSVTYDPIHKNIIATFYEITDEADIVKEAMRIKNKNRSITCYLKILDSQGSLKRKTIFRKCSIKNVKTSGFDYSSNDSCETLVVLDYETMSFGKV